MSTGTLPAIEILAEVDSGLYGKVYKGRQTTIDRIVAVKIIKPDWSRAADAIAHAKALARVKPHPNVVVVYGVEPVSVEGVGSELPAVVMEWLTGETLGERLAGPRFSEQEARRICAGILDGVEHMHAGEVAHGDLHLGNVILLSDCTPKIINIDANRDHSLARLSTISRDGAVQADVDYCRQIVFRTLSHAHLSMSALQRVDTALQEADSLNTLRTIVEAALAGNVGISHDVPRSHRTDRADVKTLVLQVQQFIENNKPVSLRSLVMEQIAIACEDLLSDRFSLNEGITLESVRGRVQRYEEVVAPLLPMIASGCFWGSDVHVRLWVECLETLANVYADHPPQGGRKIWFDFRLYPVLTTLYAAGLGAFLNDRFSTLQSLLRMPEFNDMGRVRGLSSELFHWKAEHRDSWNQLVIGEKQARYTPISDHLLHVTHRSLGGLTLLRSRFERLFDRFEYFIGLFEAYGDGRAIANPEYVWGPIGSFIWRCKDPNDSPGQQLLRDAEQQGKSWPPFTAGLYGGRMDRLQAAVAAFDTFVDRVRGQLHVW